MNGERLRRTFRKENNIALLECLVNPVEHQTFTAEFWVTEICTKLVVSRKIQFQDVDDSHFLIDTSIQIIILMFIL